MSIEQVHEYLTGLQLRIVGALEALESKSVPGWLEIEKGSFTGVVRNLPAREDVTMPIEEQLIVELYSR